MSDIKQDDPISELHDRYEQNIIPYETIVKTISMHNSQIYQLENRYHKLQKEYDRLKKQVQVNEHDIRRQRQRKIQLKRQRNLFIQQSLSKKQNEFNKKYDRQRYLRLQQIGLKHIQLLSLRKSNPNYNLFFNIDQNLLEEMIHQVQGEQDEDIKKQLRQWIGIYRQSMKRKRND